jgi:50S ribosomal subunit-associated GTPase HflX
VAAKPQVIALNKVDVLDGRRLPDRMDAYFDELGKPYGAISARTGLGVDELLATVRETVGAAKAEASTADDDSENRS